MTDWTGFWIGLGIAILGLAIDNGLSNIAQVWINRKDSDA